jgi:nucleoside-diphosphate-sugar epimerase
MQTNKIICEDIQEIVNSYHGWQVFDGKTVLVTGANGFLPAYMVETLLYLAQTQLCPNMKVLALVRNRERAEKRFVSWMKDGHLQFIVQDVCSPLTLSEPVHFIIHAASQASPKYFGTDPVGTLKANVEGTINLCELACNNPVESFLYFSSGEVYGQPHASKDCIYENDYGYLDPINVRSCYAESKRMGETICVSYLHQYNVPVKIVRPAHTYGPGMDLNDGRVFADFVCNIVENRDIVMKSDGSASRAFCYLKDATMAFFKVLIEGQNGEAYNVANPSETITIIGLAEKLVKLFPEKELKVISQPIVSSTEYLKSAVIQMQPDISKIKLLGWSPNITIEEGFFRTIKSYN